MKEILSRYSVSQVIMFIVLLAAALKGVISFFDWSHDKAQQYFTRQMQPQKERQKIQKRLQDEQEFIQKINERQQKLSQDLNELKAKINLLIDSDRDDIKSFITREHHYFCQLGWIDDYSLQCCERRYEHYRDQGGNSFILGFMNELRALPKQQLPQRKKENDGNVND